MNNLLMPELLRQLRRLDAAKADAERQVEDLKRALLQRGRQISQYQATCRQASEELASLQARHPEIIGTVRRLLLEAACMVPFRDDGAPHDTQQVEVAQ